MCSNIIDLTLVKDITLIIGSLTATLFTFGSFNKWKKEHKGKLKYELSRNLLKSIYDLRDDFKGVRSPMILASEFSPDHDYSKTKESDKYKYVFENRLKHLQKSYNTYLSLLPEVEIDYGSKVNEHCEELINHITTYHFKMTEYIQVVDNWDLFNNPHHMELKNVIFNSGKDNKTTNSFNATVDKLKAQLTKEIKKY